MRKHSLALPSRFRVSMGRRQRMSKHDLQSSPKTSRWARARRDGWGELKFLSLGAWWPLPLTKAQRALDEMRRWSGNSETDFYPCVRELFTNMFGYPKDHIHLIEKESQGKVPDLSLVSADVTPGSNTYWVIGEVKKERGVFRSGDYRKEQWERQLKNCVSADTAYALFIDPTTIVVLRPDGSEVEVVELDKHPVAELLSPMAENSLAPLHYENSVEDHRAHRIPQHP